MMALNVRYNALLEQKKKKKPYFCKPMQRWFLFASLNIWVSAYCICNRGAFDFVATVLQMSAIPNRIDAYFTTVDQPYRQQKILVIHTLPASRRGEHTLPIGIFSLFLRHHAPVQYYLYRSDSEQYIGCSRAQFSMKQLDTVFHMARISGSRTSYTSCAVDQGVIQFVAFESMLFEIIS